MSKITDKQKRAVLEEISIKEISRAIKREGMFISDSISLLIKWREVENWSRSTAIQYRLDECALRAIVFEEINEMLLKDIAHRRLL